MTQAISAAEYAARRHRLLAQLPPDSVALIPAATEAVRSRDTHYPFRQDSDFLYLTGFPEPEALLVLAPGRVQGEVLLFCRPRDVEREIWDGRRAGPEGAVARFGADQAFPVEDIDSRLPELLAGKRRLYYPLARRPEWDARVADWLNRLRAQSRAGVKPPAEFLDIEPLIHELRLFKSEAELELMAKAGDIAAAAHCRAMRAAAPGLLEYQLEAEILHEFGRQGARAPAYNSIVGGGANGCILHYVDNDAELRDGDLVLIDAGCEYHGYCSDITRTFPVNGRFGAAQRALYELVLEAQAAALEQVAPGRPWIAPHDASVRTLTAGLVKLGLLAGDVDQLIETGAYRAFYMHRVGHLLGMDVHDVGDYKVDGQWRPLAPGMVLTIEPGLYVAADNTAVAPEWRGIGIRIEDDVCVTETGYRILTAGVPKDPDAIEALMAKAG